MNIRKKEFKYIFLFFILFAVFFLSPKTVVINAQQSEIMISEFVVDPEAGGTEWIELLNPNQGSSLDLSGWKLVIYKGPEGNRTYYYQENLSGTVPRGGFLTFDSGDDISYPDDGACMVIFKSDIESVFAVKYGNGECDAGAQEEDATAINLVEGESIYYNLDEGSWNPTDAPTKGWCNPGSGECPTISTITDQMNGEGVETNLGDQDDFSRITGLYFKKTQDGEDVGKITFQAEMNFTDRDALLWMQSLDDKLSISQGIISLDADLIKNLTNTQASLTMYNIYVDEPQILVNGSDDNENIVSGLDYDRDTGTVTFTAAHFTRFEVVERSSSSSSGSSSSNASGCSEIAPAGAPDLFKVTRNGRSATLYFSPVGGASNYFISYSDQTNAEKHGVQFTPDYNDGVINYTVNELVAGLPYYFKVRGGRGCATGQWSQIMSSVVSRGSSTTFVSAAEKDEEIPSLDEADTEDEVIDEQESDEQEKLIPTKEKQLKKKITQENVLQPIEQKKESILSRIINFILGIFGR